MVRRRRSRDGPRRRPALHLRGKRRDLRRAIRDVAGRSGIRGLPAHPGGQGRRRERDLPDLLLHRQPREPILRRGRPALRFHRHGRDQPGHLRRGAAVHRPGRQHPRAQSLHHRAPRRHDDDDAGRRCRGGEPAAGRVRGGSARRRRGARAARPGGRAGGCRGDGIASGGHRPGGGNGFVLPAHERIRCRWGRDGRRWGCGGSRQRRGYRRRERGRCRRRHERPGRLDERALPFRGGRAAVPAEGGVRRRAGRLRGCRPARAPLLGAPRGRDRLLRGSDL